MSRVAFECYTGAISEHLHQFPIAVSILVVYLAAIHHLQYTDNTATRVPNGSCQEIAGNVARAPVDCRVESGIFICAWHIQYGVGTKYITHDAIA
jgi:hypothetical protein